MTHDGDAGVPGSLARVLAEVLAERVAQDARWGIQEFPDGAGPDGAVAAADQAKRAVAEAAAAGELTWRHILHEEVLEAFAESEAGRLREELIQVAAVAVKWAQAIDRRQAPPGQAHPPGLAPPSRPTSPPGLAAQTGLAGPADQRLPTDAPDQRLPADAADQAIPAGKERFRAVVAVHVLVVRGEEVLLGRRAGTGWADGMWHLPSGHLEPGESAVRAAVREAREELGVGIEPRDLTFAHVMHRAPDRLDLFFVAREWQGEPRNAEPHKCSEVRWWPLDRLPGDTVGYAAAAVAEVLGRVPFTLHEWPGES
ncbi:NUDIX hydrolase [Nonomuraea cavernae]|uniref:NUDIX hydrolase n=1 Tax=Nonomuraea cavernae TaxID=2045107 RepID=UPI0033CE881A